MMAEPKSVLERARELTSVGKKNIDDGMAILDQAHDRYGLPKGTSGTDGPLMKAWKHGAFPLRTRVPLEQTTVEGEVSMAEMITNIVTWMEAGREVPAAAALAVLRLRFEAFDPSALPENECTWDAFVRRRIKLPLERVNDLLGRMVHRGGLMRCTKCGIVAGCSCHCGAPYVGEHPWAMPVTENVTETPRRGRPASGSALTDAERKRKQRERQRNSPPPPSAPERDLIQDTHPDATDDEQRWQWSFSSAAGDAVAMRAYWSRQFPGWQELPPPAWVITLAQQAADAWKTLAQDLERRNANGEET